MSGGLQFHDSGFQAKLRDMYDRGADPSEPLESIGLLMEGSTQETIEIGGRPEDFAAWSDNYNRRAGKILILNTYLVNSIAHEVNDWEVHWGSNLAYAARMQFGWPPGSADETPARPYIQEPFDEDWDEITEILLQWIAEE